MFRSFRCRCTVGDVSHAYLGCVELFLESNVPQLFVETHASSVKIPVTYATQLLLVTVSKLGSFDICLQSPRICRINFRS